MSDFDVEEYSVLVMRDKHSGAVLSESWRGADGQLHRTHDLPAYIEYDPCSGQPKELQYWRQGVEHRDGELPSTQRISPETGVVWYERWMESGEHVEGRLAIIERDPITGRTVSEVRFVDGESVIDFPKGRNAPRNSL